MTLRYPRQMIAMLGLALCLSALIINSPTRADPPVAPTTQSFIQNAMVSNQFDILAGRLALQHTHTDAIKTFAQQMIVAHTDIALQMKKALSDGQVSVPDNLPSLDAKHQGLLDQLNALQDDGFDREYINDELALHKATLSLFHYYATRGDNESLKDFAEATLPRLKQQQDDLRSIMP